MFRFFTTTFMIVPLYALYVFHCKSKDYLGRPIWGWMDLGEACHNDTECEMKIGCTKGTCGCVNGVCDQIFLEAKEGRSSCLGSFDIREITSLEECKLAAEGLSEFVDHYSGGFVNAENSGSAPNGCYTQTRFNNQGKITSLKGVFWNDHDIGGSWEDASPICKRTNTSSKDNFLECNIKSGYKIYNNESEHAYGKAVGSAGSAENCYQMVKLKEPEANGIIWCPTFKSCDAKFGAFQLIKSRNNEDYACIFENNYQRCYTNEDERCVFPFKYGGKMYNHCYPGHGGYWCPYSTNPDGTYENWDWCKIDNCTEEI